MFQVFIFFACLAASAAPGFSGELTFHQILEEPKLEKRSELALAYADGAVDAARNAYQKPDYEAFRSAVKEVLESVELSYKSLEDTGKAARRNPKYFKRAEQKMRTLLRRLESLELEVGFDDRPPVKEAIRRITEIHDQILMDIMTKRKK